MARKINHGIKSFAREAGEESSRDERHARATVENFQGSALQHISRTLAPLQKCPEQGTQGLFQTAKSKIFRKEKNKQINSFLIS